MANKEMIKKFKDYAELAWAAYGYFDLIGKNFRKNEKYGSKSGTTITLQDIMDITYQGYNAVEIIQLGQEPKEITLREIGGDMSPTQAQNFFKRYDLLIHQPNTSSGFLATLFQDKESKEFILAMRGTEGFTRDMFITDFQLASSYVPNQYKDMLLFYYQCIGKLPFCLSKDTLIQNDLLDKNIQKRIYKNYENSKAYINPSLLKNANENLSQTKKVA